MFRYSELHKEPEVAELEYGMDFREPKYRREVFLKFYEFHIKYKAHPGAVYYAFPYIFEKLEMTREQKLWFCYINGVSQNVLTTYIIYKRYPDLKTADISEMDIWFNKNWKRLGWDSDRKYVKAKFIECVNNYKGNVYKDHKSQVEFFDSLENTDDIGINFEHVWDKVMEDFKYFGRLATFSYIEYLKIAGENLDCNNLFLEDLSGSKSHRNGLCKVNGRDDLDWHDSNPDFPGYSKEVMAELKKEGKILLDQAKERIDDPDVGYFTLESTLCCFKGWFRPNRRYPNVYNDMFRDRIVWTEERWGKDEIDLQLFWDMRKKYLPKYLRVEDVEADPGLVRSKQNHFRETGQPIMMDRDFPEFRNDFNDLTGLTV